MFSLIPIALYCLLYFVMVFALGLWNDVYQANAYLPWPVTMVLILSLAFGLSQLLRFLHNLRQRHVSETISRYYLESPDYEFPRVSDAVAFLAKNRSKYYYEGDDIDIPTDVIALLPKEHQKARTAQGLSQAWGSSRLSSAHGLARRLRIGSRFVKERAEKPWHVLREKEVLRHGI